MVAAPARFVALEGVDGSGKTTQARMLHEALIGRGRPAVLTREPGGTPLGERVRALLLDGRIAPIGPVPEAYLFAAARAALVAEIIGPALAAGSWVVSDRFIGSSLAYQGSAGGLGREAVLGLNRMAIDGRLPDLTVVIDTPLELAAERRSGAGDRIEARGAEFQERVAAGYRELAVHEPARVAIVSGIGTPGEVHDRVLERVDALG